VQAGVGERNGGSDWVGRVVDSGEGDRVETGNVCVKTGVTVAMIVGDGVQAAK
jgi:hypothetical protein